MEAIDGMPKDLNWLSHITDGKSFVPAFGQTFLMILATEIGDRTFFIAAIMAMRHPRTIVLQGALAALAVMTILSALLGRAFPLLLDRKYTGWAAAALFGYFGLAMLRNWWKTKDDTSENDELAEVEAELEKKEETATEHEMAEAEERDEPSSRPKPAAGGGAVGGIVNLIFSPIFIQAFTLTFLAEWGDRSQIATIALAAAKDLLGVTIGGILGHALCTSIAVMGGKMLASRISEATVSLFGGLIFVLFAVLSLTGIFD